MREPAREILAVITGERGRREIVRPLAAVGRSSVVLDWELLVAKSRRPHLRFVRELWRVMRAHRRAVVFTDMNSAFLAILLLFARVQRLRVLLRLRGDLFAETRDQIRFQWTKCQWPQLARSVTAWLLDRRLFPFVDRFVPVSQWIVRRLAIEERSAVVRVPVSLEAFAPRQHRFTSPLRLLAVTNFDYPQKIATLGQFLDAYSTFLSASEMQLTIAGAGSAWESFRAQHAGRADFVGFVGDVASLYAQHDVFIHFSGLDAFPYVVLEAQAAGLPVIVNRDCGMLEQVEHGVTGLVVDLEDRAAMETHLRSLRDSPELRASLGSAARRSVAENYSLTAIGRDLLTHALSPDPAGGSAT